MELIQRTWCDKQHIIAKSGERYIIQNDFEWIMTFSQAAVEAAVAKALHPKVQCLVLVIGVSRLQASDDVRRQRSVRREGTRLLRAS